MHWIIQRNFNKYFDQWEKELTSLGQKYTPIEIAPFSEDLPKVKVEGPCFAYGTTSIVKNAKKQWDPGVFFIPENFKVSTWISHLGTELLNHQGYVCTLNDLLVSGPDECFIRPNSDLKDFTGVPVKREHLLKQIENINNGGFLFDGSLEVFVAPTKHIQKEWRFFVVDNKVVSGCQYKLKTMAQMVPHIDPALMEYASHVVKTWTPDKACVMDIAQDFEGNYKVLEFNCINASGLYVCDLRKIILSLQDLIQSETK